MLLQFTFVDGLSVYGESISAPLTIQNSPFWTLTPTFSQHIRIKDLRILAPMNTIGNTDGIDISSSRDAIIENIYIKNSDDGVCMNSGAEEFGMNLAIPTEDVLVRNVTCPPGGRGGFRVGIQPGGVRNVTYRDSELNGERGLSLLGVVGGGGYIHDVLFENITNPRGISYGNYGGSPWMLAKYPSSRYLPLVWNVEFRRIKKNGHCGDCGRMANGSVCHNVTYTEGTRCEGGPPPPPRISSCPTKARGDLIRWVKVSNKSNVFGQIPGPPFNRSSAGLPFLGLFNTADECQAACEKLSNCTQYSWNLDVPSFAKLCFGRCDDVWDLHAVPPQYTVIAARRVAVGSSSLSSQQARLSEVPTLRYGCKRNATDQFGTMIRFPWPVCIPLDAAVNLHVDWPNWGPVEGDFPTLQACKDSGCKTDDDGATKDGSGPRVGLTRSKQARLGSCRPSFITRGTPRQGRKIL